MKFVLRFTNDGRTFVVRRSFDSAPTRKQIDALIDELLAQDATFTPAKRAAKS